MVQGCLGGLSIRDGTPHRAAKQLSLSAIKEKDKEKRCQ